MSPNRKQDKIPRKGNKSGITGVSFDNTRKRWQATIGFSGRSIHLGYFEDMVAAVDKRHEAEQMFKPGIETEATRYMERFHATLASSANKILS